MAKRYPVVIEQDEKGLFVSDVIGLRGCRTQARAMKELLAKTKEAIQAYREPTEVPGISEELELVGIWHIEV